MQKAFINGVILTMDKNCKVADAVLIDKASIRKVGTKEEVLQAANSKVKIIDLKGRTLLPGFVDAHGHFINTAMSQLSFVDVRCAPIGEITSIAQMIQVLKRSPQAQKGNGPIIGYGYDDTLVDDERLANAKDLDQVSTTRPVVVIHASFHLIMANSVACKNKSSGIYKGVPTIVGIKKLAKRSDVMGNLLVGIRKVSDSYLKNGVTTICEGANGNSFAKMVKVGMGMGVFPGRYILCPALTVSGKVPPRITGKFILNGPVKLTPSASQNGKMNILQLREQMEAILDSNRSFAIHCNEDLGLDVVIEAMEGCHNLNKNNYKRNIIIHCQTAREDQLKKMKELKLYPSFFPAHIYVWGDKRYSTSLDVINVEQINPIKSAVDQKMVFSLHNDSPITITNPLELVWNVVTRKTASGRVLGEEQRVTVEEALKGITIYAAYQYKLDDILGSIEVGKRADFVVLDHNPLQVSCDNLRNIQVQRVWIEGKLVWSNITKALK